MTLHFSSIARGTITIKDDTSELLITHYIPDTRVLEIYLNRPHCGNALNGPLLRKLHKVLAGTLNDGNVRAIVLGGIGDIFCSGGDLKAIAQSDISPTRISIMLNEVIKIMSIDFAVPPIVIALQLCCGAGISLGLAGTYVIAAEGPLLKNNFHVGLTIPGGGLWFVQRRGGMTAVGELLAQTQPMSAARAKQLNLVNEVVQPEFLHPRAIEVATLLAKQPRRPMALSQELLRLAPKLSLEEFLVQDHNVLVSVSEETAAAAAIAAFLGKNDSPNFITLDS